MPAFQMGPGHEGKAREGVARRGRGGRGGTGWSFSSLWLPDSDAAPSPLWDSLRLCTWNFGRLQSGTLGSWMEWHYSHLDLLWPSWCT